MTVIAWFDIECVDRTSATLYLSHDVEPAYLDHLREACDELPHSVRLLHLRIVGPISGGQLPPIPRAVARHWRQSRQGATCVVHLPDPQLPRRRPNEQRTAFAAAQAAASSLGRAVAWAARTAAFL